MAYLILDNEEAALEQLRIAVDTGFRGVRGRGDPLPYWPVRLDHNVFFAELHDNQDFIALIAFMDEENRNARERLKNGETVSPLD